MKGDMKNYRERFKGAEREKRKGTGRRGQEYREERRKRGAREEVQTGVT